MDLVINVLKSKYVLLSSAVLFPLFTYKTLLSTYQRLKYEYEKTTLFYNRHNCVVMYNPKKGRSGWPPHLERLRFDFQMDRCLDVFHEPILYFINTTNKSLDVAFMLINVNSVYAALREANKRGVKIRVLLNFDHCDGSLIHIRNLVKEGIQVLTYISQKSDLSSIMHFKFMVKDFTESGGYVITGSLNLTESAFLNNYEDMVFTSNENVVETFHRHFEECWKYIQTDNEQLINRTILLDANLI